MTDRTTFDERFGDLSAIAYRVAYRLLGDRDDAQEIAQEALARAYAHWRKIWGYDEAWVARTASNLAISRWRRRRPTVPIDERHLAHGIDPSTLALERYGLIECLRQLPRRQREVVVLRYLADLPERDVASLLQTTVGSVKQHTHRAVARLRADLAPALLAPEVDDVPAV